MLITRLYILCCQVSFSNAVKTFMALFIDITSCIFVYIAAVLIVTCNVSAENAGLALCSVLQLLIFLPWFFKMFFELISSMESVSALINFGDNVRKEVFLDKQGSVSSK